MAAGGMGMGMGFAMANQMGQSMTTPPAPATPQAQQPTAPPPLPQAKQYHLAINNQQFGPFGTDALQPYLQNGQLTRETLVWAQGMAQWIPAGQVPELASLFASTPPPLPPQ